MFGRPERRYSSNSSSRSDRYRRSVSPRSRIPSHYDYQSKSESDAEIIARLRTDLDQERRASSKLRFALDSMKESTRRPQPERSRETSPRGKKELQSVQQELVAERAVSETLRNELKRLVTSAKRYIYSLEQEIFDMRHWCQINHIDYPQKSQVAQTGRENLIRTQQQPLPQPPPSPPPAQESGSKEKELAPKPTDPPPTQPAISWIDALDSVLDYNSLPEAAKTALWQWAVAYLKSKGLELPKVPSIKAKSMTAALVPENAPLLVEVFCSTFPSLVRTEPYHTREMSSAKSLHQNDGIPEPAGSTISVGSHDSKSPRTDKLHKGLPSQSDINGKAEDSKAASKGSAPSLHPSTGQILGDPAKSSCKEPQMRQTQSTPANQSLLSNRSKQSESKPKLIHSANTPTQHEFSCNECDRSFESANSRNNHKRDVHQTAVVVTFGPTDPKKQLIKKIHGHPKPWECPFCKSLFAYIPNISEHAAQGNCHLRNAASKENVAYLFQSTDFYSSTHNKPPATSQMAQNGVSSSRQLQNQVVSVPLPPAQSQQRTPQPIILPPALVAQSQTQSLPTASSASNHNSHAIAFSNAVSPNTPPSTQTNVPQSTPLDLNNPANRVSKPAHALPSKHLRPALPKPSLETNRTNGQSTTQNNSQFAIRPDAEVINLVESDDEDLLSLQIHSSTKRASNDPAAAYNTKRVRWTGGVTVEDEGI